MFKILDEICQPTMATQFSACVDFYAREEVIIEAGKTEKVPLGVKINLKELEKNFNYKRSTFLEFLKSHYIALAIRSSMSAKHGLIIPNGEGKIDLDYPDEIMLLVHNPFKSNEMIEETRRGAITRRIIDFSCYKIEKGDRVAQGMLCQHKTYLFGITSETERTGGFGSTGKK